MLDALWRRDLEATRSVWLWPAIILASAAAVILFSLGDVATPIRAAVAFWFVLVCPGMALVRFLHIEDQVNEFILAVAVSTGIGATLATIMVLTRRWSPDWGLGILVYISVVGSILQLVTARQIFPLDSNSMVKTAIVTNRTRLYFGLMTLGLAVAAISGGTLSMDGSFQFFKALDTQAPYVPLNRFITIPFHIPIVLVSRFVDDLIVLQILFGLSYTIIPLGALALSWWIVHEKAKPLFVWAALGVGIAGLPGMFLLFSEATLAVQMFWPLFMVILMRIQKRHIPILILIPIVLIATHPFSIVLISMAVGLMFLVGLLDGTVRLKMWIWAAVFTLLGVFAALRFAQIISPYEMDRLDVNSLIRSFGPGLRGFPLTALAITWVVSLSLFFRPRLTRIQGKMILRLITSWEFIGLATAGTFFIVWASNPRNWASQLSYRHWVLFCSLPFFGLAVLEALRQQPLPSRMRAEWNHRSLIVMGTGLIFLFTFSLQSLGWINLTQRLQQTISESPLACIPASSIEWINRTPFNHFSITSYSILVQGRSPTKVVLPDNQCAEADLTTGFPLAEDWEWRRWEGGWFNMQYLKERVFTERGQGEVMVPNE